MTFVPRIATIAAALLIGAGSVASANTMELTLTVPLKITLPATGVASAALDPTSNGTNNRKLKPFDVNCVVGSSLGYATGSGAQGTIVGTGSTATSGSINALTTATGALATNPTATVIITYDDGLTATGAGTAKPVSQYLCWVAWKTAIPSLAPIFVQGTLTATGGIKGES
jgi:hypothetical protein